MAYYWTRSSDGGTQNGQLRLEFTESSTDLTARTTTYTVKIGIYVNTYQGKNTLFSRVTVNGTKKDYNGSGLWTNNSAKVWKSSSSNQFTVTIPHNDDGTSSCSVAIGANPSSSYGKTRIHTAASSGTQTTTFANASGSITLKTIAAKTYTVSYNANGGSGAPSSQTKTYGTDLTLSSTVPTYQGHDFLGWATSSTATSATYQPGGKYTTNAAATLYAVWKKKTYTVSYDANGGSGAPASQTKTYGTDLTLSSTIPTYQGFDFLGWATTDTATDPEYQPGGKYTANAAVTLYAVWEKAVTHKARVYTSGEWKLAIPHVFHNGAWVEVQEKLDVSGEWV